MSSLPLTRAHTDTCRRYLSENGLQGTPIEAYLAQYLLIVLSAEVQRAIQSVVEQYVHSANPAALRVFVPGTTDRLLRSVKSSEIAGFLGRFGQDVKERFSARLPDDIVTVYNNAIRQRHEVAHYEGTSISFRDLTSALSSAEHIIDAARDSLSVPGPQESQ